MQDALREGRGHGLRVLSGDGAIVTDESSPEMDPPQESDAGRARPDGDLDADTAPDSAPDDDPGLDEAPDDDDEAPAAPEAPPSPFADDVDALAESAGMSGESEGVEA